MTTYKRNKKVQGIGVFLAVITLLFSTSVEAYVVQVAPPTSYEATASSYRQLASVEPNNYSVPTVVELPLPTALHDVRTYGVYEIEANRFIPSTVVSKRESIDIRSQIASVPGTRTGTYMIDKSFETYADFPAGDSSANTVVLMLQTTQPVETGAIRLALAPHVAAPLTVAVKAGNSPSTLQPSVVTKRYTSNTISFPEVTARVFEVTLTHIQPLRISDIDVIENDAVVAETAALRFLAQPGSRYVVFADADRSVGQRLPEAGDLRSNTGVVTLPTALFRPNVAYTPADVDEDGVPDISDNCVRTPNTDQIDVDQNGRGDVCDDFDRDGVTNDRDNCINQPNVRQADEDGDGIGNACDEEESRLTEQNPWIPWVGIGMAGVTILTLFVLVAVQSRNRSEVAETE